MKEKDDSYHIDFISSDNTSICIDAKEANNFNPDSLFETLENASNFFEKGSLGYSPNSDKYEGLRLHIYNWQVKPLEVFNIRPSFFENETVFPKGSICLDNALLMTKAEHEWLSTTDKQYAATII